jgi:hypothetical protein
MQPSRVPGPDAHARSDFLFVESLSAISAHCFRCAVLATVFYCDCGSGELAPDLEGAKG